MESFFGRAREREDLAAALAQRDVRWISGPAGIGKSALIDAAVPAQNRQTLRGASMSGLDDAIEVIAAIVGNGPEARDPSSMGAWLESTLNQLASGHDALVWLDFDRAHRMFARIFLDTLRHRRPPFAVFLESRKRFPVPGLFSHRVRSVSLGLLDSAASRALCAHLGDNCDALPPELAGHPLLCELYITRGQRGVDGWTREVADTLDSDARRGLARLHLSRTPLQHAWAIEGISAAQRQTLRESGVTTDELQLERSFDAVAADYAREHDRLRSLEEELLSFLSGQTKLSAADMARAIELASRHPDEDAILRLEALQTPDSSQRAIGDMVSPRNLTARARLLSYRGAVDPYSAHALLAMHDELEGSRVPAEQHLAKLCFLRASVICGLRTVTPRAERYLDELMDADQLAPPIKEQILLLFGYRRLVQGPVPAEERPAMLATLATLGARPEVERGYRLMVEGYDACWRFEYADGIDRFEQSLAIFLSTGADDLAIFARRVVAQFCYMTNRDTRLQELIDGANGKAHNAKGARPIERQRGEYLAFYRAVLAWQRGDMSLLQRACAGMDERPDARRHPLLPGPHFSDYAPFCMAAIRGRALGAQPSRHHGKIVADALTRLRTFAMVSIAGLCLAQHFLLWNDDDGASLMLDSLGRASPVITPIAASMRYLANAAREGTNTEALTRALDVALRLPERLTAPYHVCLATRAALAQLENREAFRAYLARNSALNQLNGAPRKIVDGCLALLEGKPGQLMPHLEARVCTATVSRQHDVGMDLDAAALRAHIDEHWFETLKVAEFAATRKLSPDGLTRKFKRALGQSPQHYHQARRAHEASVLLVETDWNATAIAYECGYFDGAHLSRDFKRHHGISPTAFRRRWRA